MFAILNSEPPSLTSTPRTSVVPSCVIMSVVSHSENVHEWDTRHMTPPPPPSGGSVSSNCRVSPELLEGGARDKFSLLQTGDLHMVFVQEVLQFCVAVTNAVAVELQDVASPEVNTCSTVTSGILALWTLGST